jgi:hypothetical protein
MSPWGRLFPQIKRPHQRTIPHRQQFNADEVDEGFGFLGWSRVDMTQQAIHGE